MDNAESVEQVLGKSRLLMFKIAVSSSKFLLAIVVAGKVGKVIEVIVAITVSVGVMVYVVVWSSVEELDVVWSSVDGLDVVWSSVDDELDVVVEVSYGTVTYCLMTLVIFVVTTSLLSEDDDEEEEDEEDEEDDLYTVVRVVA